MLTLLVVLSVAVVLFLAASVATSDRQVLVDVAPDGRGTGLPAGRLAAGDVDAIQFGLALRGYRMDEVDHALARLAQEIAERDARVADLEQAIADAVAPAVEGVEAQLAAQEQQRMLVEAELAAAREEGPAPDPTGTTELPALPLPPIPFEPPERTEATAYRPVVPAVTSPVVAPWVAPPHPEVGEAPTEPAAPESPVVWPTVAPELEAPIVEDDFAFPEVSAPAPASFDLPEAAEPDDDREVT